MYKIPAKTLFIGKNLLFLPSCHSTNIEAANLLEKQQVNEGTIVITDNQLAGKGQRGNSWTSDPGKNLTFSLIVKSNFLPIVHQFHLNIFVSLAIADFLNQFQPGFHVKWPNDVYYDDEKICGILIQNTVKGDMLENTVIGIGLNINQQFQETKATSLAMVTGAVFDLNEVFQQLCQALEKRYLQLKRNELAYLKRDYTNRMYWYGEDHLFRDDKVFQGRIIGVSDAGLLQIESQEGLKEFNFKEVVYVS